VSSCAAPHNLVSDELNSSQNGKIISRKARKDRKGNLESIFFGLKPTANRGLDFLCVLCELCERRLLLLYFDFRLVRVRKIINLKRALNHGCHDEVGTRGLSYSNVLDFHLIIVSPFYAKIGIRRLLAQDNLLAGLPTQKGQWHDQLSFPSQLRDSMGIAPISVFLFLRGNANKKSPVLCSRQGIKVNILTHTLS
jgi:hypothetical protein